MDKSAWPIAQWGLTDDELRRIKEEMRLHPPMAITVSKGEITEIVPIYQDRAIEILRRISLNPYADQHCFFCASAEWKETHFDDCPYLLAKQLLNEIDNHGRT